MIVNIIVILLIILMVFCFYLLDRNNKVFRFEISLSNLLFDEFERILNTYRDDNEFKKDKNNYYNIRENINSLLHKHSYNKYLISFKPLKLEKWFTEEELEFIKYLKEYRK